MIVDTHAHLNFNAYKNDADEVIRRSLDNGLWMINVGSQYSTSKRAVEMAEKCPVGLPVGKQGVYAAVGLHPFHLTEGIFRTKEDFEEIEFKTQEETFDYDKYKELAKSKKVIAVGEIGLDYYYKPKTKIKLSEFKKKQKEELIKQIEFANELSLPIIFHVRAAHEDLIEILKSEILNLKSNLRGVVHCFTGTWEEAQEYMNMGFYLGFNGIIFKMDLDNIIAKTPLDKMLLETDCPYLTPPAVISINPQNPHKSVAVRNEPLYIKYVAEKIAEIKGIPVEEIYEKTTKSARKLFKI